MSGAIRALIVDDSEDDCLLEVLALTRSGFEVTSVRVETAGDLEAALRRSSWDVILVDHALPHLNSLEALAIVQAAGLDVPFIIVSDVIGEETAVNAIRAGAHDCVPKSKLDRLGSVVERELLAATARAAHGIESDRLFAAEQQARQEAENGRREVAALYEAAKRISASLDLQVTLDSILDAVIQLSGCFAAGIALLDAARSTLTYEAVRGRHSDAIRGLTMPAGVGLTGHVVTTGRVVNSPDLRQDERWVPIPVTDMDPDGIRSGVFVPLMSDDVAFGVLAAWSHDKAYFTASHERLLRGFTEHASLAIERARDITARKTAEEALRRSERHFRLLIERASEVTVILDRDFAIKYVSPLGESIFGVPNQKLVGSDPMGLVYPEDVQALGVALQAVVRDPTAAQTIRARGRGKDGAWRSFEGTAINFLDEPAVEGIVVTARDVTERVHLEEQFRQSQRMEAIGQLAGGVAHDFNNLLTVILGFGDLLVDEIGDNPVQRHSLDMIIAAGESAATLTRQLLAFSRRQVVTLQDVNVNSVVGQLTRMLRRVIGEDINLTTRFAADLGLIRADAGQLDQVLVNLAANARDAMAGGGDLKISTKNVVLTPRDIVGHPDAHPGPHVMLEVSDTGTGMDRATLVRIFEPFYTTKEIGKGTGLGLAAVFGIVSQAEGFIDVDSVVGEGTTFRICWPTSAHASVSESTSAARPRLYRGTETVLLIEDDQRVRVLARTILQTTGYTILEADSGARAIAIQREFPGSIDLILSDVVMPGMSGREAVELILQDRPGVRVLFMSGYTDDTVIRNGVVDFGASFFNKPFTPSSLTENVRKALDFLSTTP